MNGGDGQWVEIGECGKGPEGNKFFFFKQKTAYEILRCLVGSVMQHRAILRGVAQQRAREARLRAAQQQEAA